MARDAERRSTGPTRRPPVPPRVRRRGDLGLSALIVSPERPPAPATNASWAWSIRRLARRLTGALPLYAVVFGLVTLGPVDRADLAGRSLAVYLADGQWWRVIGWLTAASLGLTAMVAVAALLAATRARTTAAAGLLLGVAGVVVTLPFAALPARTPIGAVDARAVVLAGAVVQSVAWLVTGWAVARSRILAIGDGVVLMVAAPMLGVAGLLLGPLQTVGALLAFAAGLGVLWRAGRALPLLLAEPSDHPDGSPPAAESIPDKSTVAPDGSPPDGGAAATPEGAGGS